MPVSALSLSLYLSVDISLSLFIYRVMCLARATSCTQVCSKLMKLGSCDLRSWVLVSVMPNVSEWQHCNHVSALCARMVPSARARVYRMRDWCHVCACVRALKVSARRTFLVNLEVCQGK